MKISLSLYKSTDESISVTSQQQLVMWKDIINGLLTTDCVKSTNATNIYGLKFRCHNQLQHSYFHQMKVYPD